MKRNKPQATGGPVPRPRKQRFSAPSPVFIDEDKGTLKTTTGKLACAFMFLCLAFLAFVCVSLAWDSDQHSIGKLEVKQVGDMNQVLDNVTSYRIDKALLQHPDIRDKRGREFYESMLRHNQADSGFVRKLVSLSSDTDMKLGDEWITQPDAKLPENACSYTPPRARATLKN